MANELTIEQLKFAREIGATWRRDQTDNWYKSVGGQCYVYNKTDNNWERAIDDGHFLDWVQAYEIDFSPLGDYYADKELDIAATGGEVDSGLLKDSGIISTVNLGSNSEYNDDPKSIPAKMYDKYPAYFKDFSGDDEADVYLIHHKFGIDDPSGCIHHASKKLLLSGVRTGGKSKHQDVKEARDTLNRWLEINKEIDNE